MKRSFIILPLVLSDSDRLTQNNVCNSIILPSEICIATLIYKILNDITYSQYYIEYRIALCTILFRIHHDNFVVKVLFVHCALNTRTVIRQFSIHQHIVHDHYI